MENKGIWRSLNESDLSALLAFCRANEEYYSYIMYKPDRESLREQLTILPPNTGPEQKHFVGLWNGEQLQAILDLILDWPQKGVAYIGWFMVAKELQGKGAGKTLIKEVSHRLRESGYYKIRLGCAEKNLPGLRFWETCGFSATGEIRDMGSYKVVLLEKKL